MPSTIQIQVPDALIRAFGGGASELPRRTLEAATAQEYAEGHLTHVEVSQILGLSRFETDAFLKRRGAFQKIDPAEYADDAETLRTFLKQ